MIGIRCSERDVVNFTLLGNHPDAFNFTRPTGTVSIATPDPKHLLSGDHVHVFYNDIRMRIEQFLS